MIGKKILLTFKVVVFIIVAYAIAYEQSGKDNAILQSEMQWAQRASVIDLLRADCPLSVSAALRELLRRGEQAKQEIILLLRTGKLNKDLFIRAVSILAMLFHAREAAAYARQLVKDKDTLVRINAIRVLGTVGDKSDVQMLITLMEDENPFVAIEAIRTLGKIGDAKALDALRKKAKQPRNEIERQDLKRAIRQIEIMHSPNRAKELIEAIQSDDIFLVLWAVKKVSQFKIKEAKSIMRKLLETSKDLRLKVGLLKALKDIGEVLTHEEEQFLAKHPPALYGF